MKKYISSVSRGNGCGVLVGDLFITAGHVVVNADNITIHIDNQDIRLGKPLYCSYSKDKGTSIPDIAIYKLSGVYSPLTLADELPKRGDILTSISIRNITNQKYLKSPNDMEMVICDAEVNEVYNDGESVYFGATTTEQLNVGSSGSPIINGEKVFGILIGGNIDQNLEGYNPRFCGFLSSISIKQIIDNLPSI